MSRSGQLSLEWVMKKLLPSIIARQPIGGGGGGAARRASSVDAGGGAVAAAAASSSEAAASAQQSAPPPQDDSSSASNSEFCGVNPKCVVPPQMITAILDEALSVLQTSPTHSDAFREVVIDEPRSRLVLLGPTRGHSVPLARLVLHWLKKAQQRQEETMGDDGGRGDETDSNAAAAAVSPPLELPTFVFLGDYIDSGPCSMETLCIVLSLMVAYERKFESVPASSRARPLVVALRGRHEHQFPANVRWTGAPAAGYRRVDDEVADIFDHRLDGTPHSLINACAKLQSVFSWLPVAAAVHCLSRPGERNTYLCMPGGPSPGLLRHASLADMRNVVNEAAQRVLRQSRGGGSGGADRSATSSAAPSPAKSTDLQHQETTSTATAAACAADPSPAPSGARRGSAFSAVRSFATEAQRQIIKDLATAEPYEDDEDRAATTGGILFSDNPDPSRDPGMCCYSTEAAATLLARCGADCIFRGNGYSMVKTTIDKQLANAAGLASSAVTGRARASPYDPGFRLYRLPSHVRRAVQKGAVPAPGNLATPLMSRNSSLQDLSDMIFGDGGGDDQLHGAADDDDYTFGGGGLAGAVFMHNPSSSSIGNSSNSSLVEDSATGTPGSPSLAPPQHEQQQQRKPPQQAGGGSSAGTGASGFTTAAAAAVVVPQMTLQHSQQHPPSHEQQQQHEGTAATGLPQVVSLFSAPFFGTNFRNRNFGCAVTIQLQSSHAHDYAEHRQRSEDAITTTATAAAANENDVEHDEVLVARAIRQQRRRDSEARRARGGVLVSLLQMRDAEPLLFSPPITPRRDGADSGDRDGAADGGLEGDADPGQAMGRQQQQQQQEHEEFPLDDNERSFLLRVRRLCNALKARRQFGLMTKARRQMAMQQQNQKEDEDNAEVEKQQQNEQQPEVHVDVNGVPAVEEEEEQRDEDGEVEEELEAATAEEAVVVDEN